MSDKAELDELCRQALQEKRDEQRAIDLYNQVLRRDPNHVQALSALGALHHSSGRLDQARQLYELVLDIEPNRYRTVYNLGRLAHDSGKLAEAQRYYERVLTLDCDSAIACNALAFLGLLHQQLHQDFEAAQRCYEASLERSPEHIRTLDHQCAWEMGRPGGSKEAAAALHGRILRLDPAHGTHMCAYQNALFSGELLDAESRAAAHPRPPPPSSSPALSARRRSSSPASPPRANPDSPLRSIPRTNSASLLTRLSSSLKVSPSQPLTPRPRMLPESARALAVGRLVLT